MLEGEGSLDALADGELLRLSGSSSRLKLRFRNMRGRDDDERQSENAHRDEERRIGIGDLGVLRNVTDEITHEHGHDRGAQGVAGSAPLDELVTLVSTTTESVEHRVHNRVEHTHRESGDERAEDVDREAADNS